MQFFFLKATKQSNGLMKLLLCTAESTLWTMAEPWVCAQEEPAGIGFMLPPMDVSLDMPSKHACGRRKIGEWVGWGGGIEVARGRSESGIHRSLGVSLYQLFMHLYSVHLRYAQNT